MLCGKKMFRNLQSAIPMSLRGSSEQSVRRKNVIRAVIFDLDNTLVDFVRMKENAIDAAVDAMIDAGLEMSKEEA